MFGARGGVLRASVQCAVALVAHGRERFLVAHHSPEGRFPDARVLQVNVESPHGLENPRGSRLLSPAALVSGVSRTTPAILDDPP
eukprot:4512442-Pyramimonas_sp.AAC.1